FPPANPPVADSTFRLRRGGSSLSSIRFGDQSTCSVPRRRYLFLVTAGWDAGKNPGPLRMSVGFDGELCGPGHPLIAPKPLVGHRPGQRYPRDYMLVVSVQFDV